MVESLEIVNYLEQFFSPKLLTDKTVIITAGPTREIIDPVRYISNRSSGKMGYALAEAAKNMGANVILISGPVNLSASVGVQCISVQSAEQMQQAILDNIKNCDIFIAAAAVADYRCENIAQQKIKKTSDKLTLELIRNPDIISTVANLPNKPFMVGFAAETDNIIEHAKTKLKNKNLDMIAANQVGENIAFDSEQNQLTVLWEGGQQELPLMSKKQLAMELIKLIIKHYT